MTSPKHSVSVSSSEWSLINQDGVTESCQSITYLETQDGEVVEYHHHETCTTSSDIRLDVTSSPEEQIAEWNDVASSPDIPDEAPAPEETKSSFNPANISTGIKNYQDGALGCAIADLLTSVELDCGGTSIGEYMRDRELEKYPKKD